MASSSTPLNDFITRIQTDSDLQKQYAADPTGTMTAAGLTAESQGVVQSDDPEQIGAAMAQESGAPPATGWMTVPPVA